LVVPEISVRGLKFPEGPRWRDGTWWLSDQLGDVVLRVAEDGAVETVGELSSPSGLGFAPDGALLAARMNDPSIVRISGGSVIELVDLRGSARYLNDMFVAPDGRMYVDAYDDHIDMSSHRLLLVTPENSPAVAADDLRYPNGVAVTPRGDTLLVSETFARRLTAFDVGTDGTLSRRRVWAALPDGTNPDGFCIDASGDVWLASYLSGEFLHVHEGGEVLQRLEFPGRWALSCSLGGDDGRTLLLCTSETSQDDYFAGRAIGHLDTVRVRTPGVQRP
jgi:sugar lactone lactonase YvrE